MKPYIAALLFIFLVSNSAFAVRVTGTGYGETVNEARKEALAELSQNIRVEVNSEFKSVITQRNEALDELKTKAIHLKSELPILGAEFDQLNSRDGFMVEAVLKSDKTLDLYVLELKKIKNRIVKNLASLDSAKTNATKVELLNAILTDIDQYYKHRIVAQLLKGDNLPEVAITEADIKSRLTGIEKKADTINFGARIIARKMKKKKGIYIYPPAAENSSEVTQFGSAVKDNLSKYLKTSPSPEKAKFFLTGEYRILDHGIELTCHLSDRKNNTVKTAMAFFLPSAYRGYTVKPVTLDFEKLVKSGFIVSGDFRVDVKTAKGKRDLLYKSGDTMRLMVKMNKPGYFYLVSHNLKDKKYSYIINFTEEDGNRKFVYYVSGDYVNKWLELGEFEVVPPFGVETLQMLASTKDIVNQVPKHFYDEKTGLYKIGKKKSGKKSPTASKPEKALAATRGLVMKKKEATAEAILVFTSMKP